MCYLSEPLSLAGTTYSYPPTSHLNRCSNCLYFVLFVVFYVVPLLLLNDADAGYTCDDDLRVVHHVFNTETDANTFVNTLTLGRELLHVYDVERCSTLPR